MLRGRAARDQTEAGRGAHPRAGAGARGLALALTEELEARAGRTRCPEACQLLARCAGGDRLPEGLDLVARSAMPAPGLGHQEGGAAGKEGRGEEGERERESADGDARGPRHRDRAAHRAPGGDVRVYGPQPAAPRWRRRRRRRGRLVPTETSTGGDGRRGRAVHAGGRGARPPPAPVEGAARGARARATPARGV